MVIIRTVQDASLLHVTVIAIKAACLMIEHIVTNSIANMTLMLRTSVTKDWAIAQTVAAFLTVQIRNAGPVKQGPEGISVSLARGASQLDFKETVTTIKAANVFKQTDVKVTNPVSKTGMVGHRAASFHGLLHKRIHFKLQEGENGPMCTCGAIGNCIGLFTGPKGVAAERNVQAGDALLRMCSEKLDKMGRA